MRVRKGRRQEWNMSMASMSDIAFLLIIFFAVAGKFTRSEKTVALPTAAASDRMTPRDVEVVVTREGRFALNGVPVYDSTELVEALRGFITQDMSQEARTVAVFADADTPWRHTKLAVDAVNRADGNLEIAVRAAR